MYKRQVSTPGERGKIVRGVTDLGPCEKPTYSEPFSAPGCDYLVALNGHTWGERPEIVVTPLVAGVLGTALTVADGATKRVLGWSFQL